MPKGYEYKKAYPNNGVMPTRENKYLVEITVEPIDGYLSDAPQVPNARGERRKDAFHHGAICVAAVGGCDV